MGLKDRIVAGLKEAIAFERGHPGQFKISNFHVRIGKGRASITDIDAGTTRIIPVSEAPKAKPAKKRAECVECGAPLTWYERYFWFGLCDLHWDDR